MRLWISGPRILGIRPGISFRLDELLRRPSPRRQLHGCFVYVVQADNGNVKIGVTSHPETRLAQIQTGISHRINYAFIAPTSR
jgi:hypothetical protein